ncbi:MAG TPA: hypothetical protein VHC69_31625 [Polyangiaceae bacterium]|nr:hypothetical protein [Polyangiaceae bacterium]
MPTPLLQQKRTLMSQIYAPYAANGLGAGVPRSSLPTDATSSAILDAWAGTPGLISYTQGPDPSKVGQPRPPTLPQSQAWPPLVQFVQITLKGIQLYESLPTDPSAPLSPLFP